MSQMLVRSFNPNLRSNEINRVDSFPDISFLQRLTLVPSLSILGRFFTIDSGWMRWRQNDEV